MESNFVPLTEEQAGGCKFPPSCSVYITDDGNKTNEVLGHGHVHQCYLQLMPKMEILYEIQFYGDQQMEMVPEEHLRFQNGTRVLYQKQEAVVLGMCSLPADRKIVHNRNYWYTIEMEPATGIIHDADQDELIFLNELDSNIEDAVNVAANTKENDAQLVSCNEMEASSNAIVCESAETKLNIGHGQQRDDESVDHLAREDAQKENIPIPQDSSVQNSFREQEDNFESLYGQDILVEKVEKKNIDQVEISDKDRETSKEACLDDLDAKEKDNVLVCLPCSPLKRKNPSSLYIIPARRTPGPAAVVPNSCPDPMKRLRTDESDVYDESDRKRRVSTDSYDEIIGKNDEASGTHKGREWCIVNGKVLFYCSECGTGEWTNHKTSDHGCDEQKRYHIFTIFHGNSSPIQLRANFEPYGKVFYCDVAERGGYGVLTVDYDAWKWAKSVHKRVFPVPDIWRICISSIDCGANGTVFNHMYYDGIFKPFRNNLKTVHDYDNRSVQCCVRYHVIGSCFRDCSWSESHREVEKEKITDILRWCEVNVRLSNYEVKNPSYMNDIFREYKHRVKDLLAGNKSVPKSDYGNGAMCLYWNLQGSCCGFCSCLRDHVDQTKEKLQELLSWCKQATTVETTRGGSISSTEQDFIGRQNPNYMDIFLPYQEDLCKVLKYRENYGQIPKIFDGIRKNRLCVFYYVKGSCNTPTCDFHHGTCSEDVTMKLLSWCQQVLPIKTKHQKESKVVNPDYNKELFQSFSCTFPKILAAFKEASSISEWAKSTTCFQFHVQGHCTTSCSKSENHVKLDEDQINNIFMWCLNHSPLDTAEGLL